MTRKALWLKAMRRGRRRLGPRPAAEIKNARRESHIIRLCCSRPSASYQLPPRADQLFVRRLLIFSTDLEFESIRILEVQAVSGGARFQSAPLQLIRHGSANILILIPTRDGQTNMIDGRRCG